MVQLLVAIGYEYLSPAETLKQRKGRGSNVLLEGVLEEKLKKLNCVHHKGQEYLFSEENIQTAIQKLKNTKYDGLVRNNEGSRRWRETRRALISITLIGKFRAETAIT